MTLFKLCNEDDFANMMIDKDIPKYYRNSMAASNACARKTDISDFFYQSGVTAHIYRTQTVKLRLFPFHSNLRALMGI